MTRLLQIWLVLFGANLFAAVTVGILGFQVIDLRFEVFAQSILVPWAQAITVWWFLARTRSVSLAGSVKEVVKKQPALALFFLADAIILASSWEWGANSLEALSRDWRVATLYVGLKALIGGGLILTIAWGTKQVSSRERAWVAVFGVGLIAYGSTCFFDWLGFFPGFLPSRLPLLYRWLLSYGPLFVVSLGVLTKVETLWRSRAPVAARFLNVAPALLLVSATVVVLGTFNNPDLPPLGNQVVRSSAFLAIAALWVSIWHFFAEAGPRGGVNLRDGN